MKQQQGFTLIELIVVIVILGILAATALPKFSNLQVDARIAKLNAARGAVQAAAAVTHATALARAGVADTVACSGGGLASNIIANGTVCTESGLVTLVNGYPSAASIVSAAGLSSLFTPTLADLNNEGYAAVVVAPLTTFSVIGGTGTAAVAGGQANGTCSFTYNEAGAIGQAPAIGVINKAGC